MEGYIGYKAGLPPDGDWMTKDDLAQEARIAIVRATRKLDYGTGYLRGVVKHAMTDYLRRGTSVDRTWPSRDRSRVYEFESLDKPKRPGSKALNHGHKGEAIFEEAVDTRIMLDQLATHLSRRERGVLACLRRGYSQADAGRMMECSQTTVHRILADIKAIARRLWGIGRADEALATI